MRFLRISAGPPATGSSEQFSEFTDRSGLIGFEFSDGDDLHYGWAHVSCTRQQLTIHSCSWETDSHAPITTAAPGDRGPVVAPTPTAVDAAGIRRRQVA